MRSIFFRLVIVSALLCAVVLSCQAQEFDDKEYIADTIMIPMGEEVKEVLVLVNRATGAVEYYQDIREGWVSTEGSDIDWQRLYEYQKQLRETPAQPEETHVSADLEGRYE